MVMTSLKRWKGSPFLLIPVIAGLLLMGAPMNAAWAAPGKGKGPGPSPPPPGPVNDGQDDLRALARAAGLESLRVAITVKDGVNDNWTPLLLNQGRVPLPNDLNAYLNSKNKNARKLATQLGKALFWDQAVGSDGQACASCHFHAGADNRTKNQLNPNITRVENQRDGNVIGFSNAAGDPDFVFDLVDPSGATGPNYILNKDDFPFVKDIGTGDDNGQNVQIQDDVTVLPGEGNTNDVASSQGVFFTTFESVVQENIYDPFALGSDPVKIRDKGEPIPDVEAEGGANFQVTATNGAFDGKVNVRRVEPRNTPSMVNAVFNLHNFWDGRANNRFNGVNPLGDTDRGARIFVRGRGGGMATRNVSLKNASLASQAVGPPLSHFEMSFGNPNDDNTFNDRLWPDIGKKMVGSPFPADPPARARQLLESQEVATDDSLLGELRNSKGAFSSSKGINVTYKELIQQAFNPNLWDSNRVIIFPGAEVEATATSTVLQDLGEPLIVTIAEAQAMVASGVVKPERVFTQMEANFSFFFGIAVMLYEAELVADQSKFDKFMEGQTTLSDEEALGLQVFINASGVTPGKCVNCHGGPEFSNATVRNSQNGANLIEPMPMGDGNPAFYDNGFYNIGVTPTVEDLGRGANIGGFPVSSSRQFLFKDNGIQNINFPIIGLPIKVVCDPENVDADSDPATCDSGLLGVIDEGTGQFIPVCQDLNADGKCDVNDDILIQRVAVDGAFKTPQLRGVELTGPYWHNGGILTLMEVVEFYDDGGFFCKFNFPDLDPDIVQLGLSGDEREGLVHFMLALTDDRVKNKRAPFDHPELRIPNGHPGDVDSTTADGDFDSMQAVDVVLTLPAVGAGGVTSAGLDPLRPFHEELDENLTHFDAFEVEGVPCNLPNLE